MSGRRCPLVGAAGGLRRPLVVALVALLPTARGMALRITGGNQALSEPLKAYAEMKMNKPLERHAEYLRTDVEVCARRLRNAVACLGP